MAYIYDLTDTWNAGGTTFNAIKMNVTDSASASASKLVTLQTNGTEHFSVTKGGQGYFSGNVGIGTASPIGRLDVFQNSSATAFVRTSNQTLKLTADDAGSRVDIANSAASDITLTAGVTERMRITNTGPVLIGLSSAYQAAANATNLQIGDPLTTSGAGISLGATTTNDIAFADNTTGAGQYAGLIRYSHSSDHMALWTASTERMRLDSNGNLGIGTTTAVARLHTNGGAGGINAVLESNTAADTRIEFRNNATRAGYLYWDANEVRLLADPTRAVTLFTNGVERMRITSAGNVGIGTSSPANKFVVSNSGANGFEVEPTSGIIQTYNRSTGAYTGMLTYALEQRFFTGSSPSERMRIDSSGNLLVGTTSASGKLAVKSDQGEVGFNTGSSSSPERANLWYDTDGSGWRFNIGKRQSGSFTSQISLKDSGQLRFVPLASAPSGAEAGDVYYDSTTNKLRCYNGTTWNDLF